ncbi:DNA-binding response regulator [Paractinoplanes abujensis]|uniref:Two-component system OmpR family response regulator n=1 Tax=Paractinoplanes abujensis TaxID=882441 RepID=A0A7W7CMM4_9ACTN|nr:response regulator transcription factor [Actinoplanes abujensis]MBB4691084.1 two-component system OmpR family response regulator [Actinoplanes abujensis]GID17503.1 DNA-binding response regulator [Actinoplanes abujensis]
MMDRVLVVDDDPGLRGLLTSALRFAGYEVDVAADIPQALDRVLASPPDVIVLDVMLPGGTGFDVVTMLRARSVAVPVLFLTARDAVEDRVRGLQLGGDDYMVKPFSVVEVGARIEALLRRARGAAVPAGAALTFRDLSLDPQRHEVRRADRPVALSPTEFKLLHLLITRPGQVLSKAQILEAVWQYDFGGDSVVVERFIANLRRKVDDGHEPLIQTVRGVGYTLRAPGR